MRRWLKYLAVAALVFLSLQGITQAQSVQQGGATAPTPGHVATWVTNGVIGDGGTASSGNITSLGITANGGLPDCINSGPITGSYWALCFGVGSSGGTISLQPYGGAADIPLNISVNGTTIAFTDGAWLSSLLDQQFSNAAGSILYRSSTSWAALAPGNSGQALEAQGAGLPVRWTSIPGTGTVTSLTAGTGLTGGTIVSSGTIALAVPVAVANGGTGLSTIAAHGVLLGEGTGNIAATSPGSAGTCLTSNGASSDPTFQACPGSGTVTSITAGNGGITVTPSPLTTTGTISVTANGVTNTMLAQAGADTLKGNNTGATANVADLTPGQVGAILCQPQITALTASGTYTTPTCNGVVAQTLFVHMAGAGGGGAGSGTGGVGGGSGGNTTFGTALLTANGGGAGSTAVASSGGTATGGYLDITGSGGQGATTTSPEPGGAGGGSCFGPGGGGGIPGGSSPLPGIAPGAGGGGGAISGAGASGGGGAGGGCLEALIALPGTSYPYAVGVAGTAGTAGTGGTAGAVGAAGIIVVKAAWQ